MLLCSAFNGLTQRAWIELRAAGHDVRVQLGPDMDAAGAAASAFDPDLIVCPFLRERVPDEVWRRYRTIIIHPGPAGDRGPSSLDWALADRVRVWGVTALQAVDDLDGGPVWATRTFPVPAGVRKSTLYNGPVTDAAIALIHEVVARAADPIFVPRPAERWDSETRGRPRPVMRQVDRAFSWSDATDDIVRQIRAADGAPGVRTVLAGTDVFVYDAQPGPVTSPGHAGTIAARHHGALLVRTGDGAVWIGQLRRAGATATRSIKLPATLALTDAVSGVPELLSRPGLPAGFRDVRYERTGDVGVVSFDFYNGAMSTADCRRLAHVLQRAVTQDTRVLVVRGGETFSNGIHLNVIDATSCPEVEAWQNIVAIDEVCRMIITCTDQLVVAAVGGSSGAGGTMLALGADRVVVRDGVVLNPHYATMGLYGSEYWTYVLPRRVGDEQARQLTEACWPIGAAEAVGLGLGDELGSGTRDEFDRAVVDYAHQLTDRDDYPRLLATKRARRAADERRRPLARYRADELTQMRQDICHDRNGFAAVRQAFVRKQPRPTAPDRPLGSDRPGSAPERRLEAGSELGA
jgi:putative two-component system hydrogenase maturation factor HypX/HoxX